MKIRRTFLRASRRNRQHGQGMVEYALLLSLIALAAIGAIATLGPTIAHVFTQTYESISPERPTDFTPGPPKPLSVVFNDTVYTLAYLPMFADETLS